MIKRKRLAMTSAAYEIVAGVVRTLPADVKQSVADHFAREFNRRSPSFDPLMWEQRTGGRINSTSGGGAGAPDTDSLCLREQGPPPGDGRAAA
jgi:hypothetical protein